jgi:hypothetical protein
MLLVLGVALGAATPGSAQLNGGAIGARASVQGPMAVVALQGLDFGTVLPGTPATVAPNTAQAGVWMVSGTPNAFVDISFTLPSVQNNIQAAPGITMPISFNATAARWRRQTAGLTAGTVFNPAVGDVGRLGPGPRPDMYIYIGGTVTPAPTQLPGRYQGTIMVNLFYP